jgi:hypothetical protein
MISIKLEQALAVFGKNVRGNHLRQGPGRKIEVRF